MEYFIWKKRCTCTLCLFHKIKNSNEFYNLRIIFNRITEHRPTQYNLRNDNIKVPKCRLNLFKNSFFIRAITLWNNLPNEIKSIESYNLFKLRILPKKKINKTFYYGPRFFNIHLARIRMGCSLLNSHLCLLLHVIESPICNCGFYNENPKHYFLECPLFQHERATMLRKISNITQNEVNLNTILFGDKNESFHTNKNILDCIFEYMNNTQRFK